MDSAWLQSVGSKIWHNWATEVHLKLKVTLPGIPSCITPDGLLLHCPLDSTMTCSDIVPLLNLFHFLVFLIDTKVLLSPKYILYLENYKGQRNCVKMSPGVAWKKVDTTEGLDTYRHLYSRNFVNPHHSVTGTRPEQCKTKSTQNNLKARHSVYNEIKRGCKLGK